MGQKDSSSLSFIVDAGLTIVILILIAILGLRASLLAASILCLGAGLFVGRTFAEATSASEPLWRSAFSVCGLLIVFFAVRAMWEGWWGYALFSGMAFGSASLGLYIRSLVAPARLMQLGILLMAWVAGTAGAAFVGLPVALENRFALVEEGDLPVVALQTLDGNVVSTADWAGTVVVLDFWASWCGPCIRQFPELEQVYAQYRDNPNVEVIAINTSWDGDSMQRARAFVQSRGLQVPVLYDAGSVLTHQLGITSIPHTLVLDQSGQIRSRHTGFVPEAGYFVTAISGQIKDLLAETGNR